MTHQYMEIKIEELEKRIQALEQEPTDDKCHYCEHNFTPYKGNTGEFEPQEREEE